MDERIKEASLDINGPAEKNVVIMNSVKHYDDTNEIIIEGPVINVYPIRKMVKKKDGTESEETVSVLLTIITNTGRTGQETSGVTVAVGEKFKDGFDKFQKGQHLHIEGKLYSRKLKDRDDAYEPGIRAEKIEGQKSLMEDRFGFSGRLYGAPFNRITLVGNITRITLANRNTALISLFVNEKGEKPRYLDVTLMANNLSRIMPNIMVGNRVAMTGEYRVRKWESPQKDVTRYYRNIIALDIQNI